MRHSPLIRLGCPQLALTASGMGTVLCAVWIMFMPEWRYLYVRQVVVPHLERQYGFRVTTRTFSRDGTSWQGDVIVDIRPRSELARLGIRNGEAPSASHRGGWTYFANALDAYERNWPAEFDVVSVDDWNAGLGQRAFRTITLRTRR